MVQQNTLPNIIIFVPDEMRGDAISLGGKHNQVIKTPNIDLLAQEGAVFTKCFTVNPICVPSRCCTFTGQYIHSNNHRSLYQLLQPHEENLFKFLKKKGYEVVWIGRNDLFSRNAIKESVTKSIKTLFPKKVKNISDQIRLNPFNKNHRYRKSFYYGERTQEQSMDSDYRAINGALNYLDSKPSKPFCLYIALNSPHPPYTVEEPYFSMYDRKLVPAPIPPILDGKPEFMRLIHKGMG